MQMRVAWAGAIALGLAVTGAAPPATAQDGSTDGLRLPGGPRRSRTFDLTVNHAIDRGVAFLRKQQRPDGGFDFGRYERFHIKGPESLGPTALCVYTIRACGAGFDDEAVIRGITRLREMYLVAKKRGGAVHLDNYGVSLTVLALEAHWSDPETPPEGGERYGPLASGRRRISRADLEWLEELRDWLVQAQTMDGSFSYWSPARGNQRYDYSNMQYSLLALKALRRMGLDVETSVWHRAAEHLVSSQEKKGPQVPRWEPAGVDEEGYGASGKRKAGQDRARGWGYVAGNPSTGSMTAGGVSSLVICRSELLGKPGWGKRADEKVVRAIRDGLGWLGHEFTVERNPGAANAPAMKELWHYYYLYGLERAGILAGVPFVGEHDWYLEGALYLVDEQRDNGSWLGQDALDSAPMPGSAPEPRTANMADSCFALLFLKRATFKVTRGAVATQREDDTLNLEGADELDDDAFGPVFDAVFSRYLRTMDDDRGERAADFVRLGTRSLPRLILQLDGSDDGRRAAASDALERLTGETRGYDAAAPAEARETAVAAWEQWWFLHKDGLRRDTEEGRFVEAPPATNK